MEEELHTKIEWDPSAVHRSWVDPEGWLIMKTHKSNAQMLPCLPLVIPPWIVCINLVSSGYVIHWLGVLDHGVIGILVPVPTSPVHNLAVGVFSSGTLSLFHWNCFWFTYTVYQWLFAPPTLTRQGVGMLWVFQCLQAFRPFKQCLRPFPNNNLHRQKGEKGIFSTMTIY